MRSQSVIRLCRFLGLVGKLYHKPRIRQRLQLRYPEKYVITAKNDEAYSYSREYYVNFHQHMSLHFMHLALLVFNAASATSSSLFQGELLTRI